MQTQDHLPTNFRDLTGSVVVLEAGAGAARRAALEAWAQAARADGAEAWVVGCAVSGGGIWGGLNTWLEAILPRLRAEAPELVTRHDRELTAALPRLKREISVRHMTLTETAQDDEAVRNFALDRAYRIPHGLIDMLAEWHQASGAGRWVVACDEYDDSGALAARFFRELVRRRGKALGLTLLVAVRPGAGDAVAASFARGVDVRRAALDLVADAPETIDPAEATRRAQALEDRVGHDVVEAEIHLHELIDLWARSERPGRSLAWHGAAVGLYNHLGYYEDAVRYADVVEASLSDFHPEDHFFGRQNLVGNLCNSYIPTGQVERARELVEREVLAVVEDPEERTRAYYKLAMIWARHHPKKDLAKGEAYLHDAFRELDRATEADGDPRYFMRVFLHNGMAFIRHRQGRPADAVDLTREGSATLDANLAPDRHRLHRSVLLYNSAQVYAATGAHEAALEAFTAAMEMDPGYSEYYNERGNIYLATGRHAQAEADYRAAIECSPPYPEVWVNLGQCFRQTGRHAEAVHAYSVALDLDPSRHIAWVSRAQLRAATGDPAGAIADYDAAIALDATQPFVYANRAVLRYTAGDVAGSRDDLDRAIALAPDAAALYRNRAAAQKDLGEPSREAADLAAYLRLAPGAPDAAAIRARLDALSAAVAA